MPYQFQHAYIEYMNQDSSVSTVTRKRGAWLRNWGKTVSSSSRLFSSLKTKCCTAQTASYSADTWSSVSEVKWLEHEADHSPPTSVKIKNEWSYTSTSPCLFWNTPGKLFSHSAHSAARSHICKFQAIIHIT